MYVSQPLCSKLVKEGGGWSKNSQSSANVVYERPYMRNTNSGKKQIHTLHTTLRKIYQETFLVGFIIIIIGRFEEYKQFNIRIFSIIL